ncbi:MFS transporter [Pedobacter jamesrossensis]|uniref:Lysosomal dipeptide transporter MFSD1 n=1 Tax=Pedobacter jamesrossensis TaxID=1908238 RepID=A0ABV8NMN4_9SPHI
MDNTDLNKGKDSLKRAFIISWILGLIFYFLEYVARSSPAVMIPELSANLKISTLAVSSVLGTYYYTYSVTSLIAGISLDRFGARYPITIGVATLCLGCLIFASHSIFLGDLGRLLQGAGSAFAFTGCVYLASHGFAAKYLATAIGFTQCVGMLGGSVGQFAVGPMIHGGISVGLFWPGMAVLCGIICVLLYLTVPKEKPNPENKKNMAGILMPYKIVFSNPQSYLSGMISGLLFAPTTIFAMTWGVAFLQHDRMYSYSNAVLVCSMVPLGWVIGCPLIGWISDVMGKRKPVISLSISVMILCFAQLIYMPQMISPIITMLLFGTASGAAMIPYSIIKESNPDKVKGSATGAINFITFGITAILGPIFSRLYGKTLETGIDHEKHFSGAGNFMLIVMAAALIVSLIIHETGQKAEHAQRLYRS